TAAVEFCLAGQRFHELAAALGDRGREGDADECGGGGEGEEQSSSGRHDTSPLSLPARRRRYTTAAPWAGGVNSRSCPQRMFWFTTGDRGRIATRDSRDDNDRRNDAVELIGRRSSFDFNYCHMRTSPERRRAQRIIAMRPLPILSLLIASLI